MLSAIVARYVSLELRKTEFELCGVTDAEVEKQFAELVDVTEARTLVFVVLAISRLQGRGNSK